LQQYIELVRTQDKMKKLEAIMHAKKYLIPNHESQKTEILRAAGLLVFTQDTKALPYKVKYPQSATRTGCLIDILVPIFAGSLESSVRPFCPDTP
jgi:macrophage erythroblast attacher